MPDHVHLLVTPFEEIRLSSIMDSIKGASAHAINRVLGRRGAMWQRESFDHILRSDEKLTEKGEYIANNPVRAGLVAKSDEWPWLWRAL
jgi:REP element-mobilizing transposase RayT